MEIENQDIQTVINCLSRFIKDENNTIANYAIKQDATLQGAVDCIHKGQYKEFNSLLIVPLEKLLFGLMETALPNKEKAHFLLLHRPYVERHLSQLFLSIEGSACSADKAKTCIDALLNFFINGTKILFDYNKKYTFHLPKTILKSHADITEYFNSLERLYYGNPDMYLAFLSNKIYGGNKSSQGADKVDEALSVVKGSKNV